MIPLRRVENSFDFVLPFKMPKFLVAFFELFWTVSVPLAGDDGDVLVKTRTAETFNPAYGSQTVLEHSSVGRPVEEHNPSNGCNPSEHVQAAHNVPEVVLTTQVRGPKASRIDEDILLSIDDSWTDLIIDGPWVKIVSARLEESATFYKPE